jgi:hypothetical protein
MDLANYDNSGVLDAFFSSITFLIGYSLLAKWWRRPVGRAVAALDVALIIALAPFALHVLFHLNLSQLWFAWYYGSALHLTALVTLSRLVVIWTVQRESIRDDLRGGKHRPINK